MKKTIFSLFIGDDRSGLMSEQDIDELRDYLESWLTSRDINRNSEYHAGAAKVAQKVLMRLQNVRRSKRSPN